MSRNRDIANVLSKSTAIALDSEVGLVPVTPSSIAVTGGSGSISLNTVSFTSASAVSLNDVFSATHQNYRILVNLTSKSAQGFLQVRLRIAGEDNSTSNYHNFGLGRTNAQATVTLDLASQTTWRIGEASNSNILLFSSFDLSDVFIATQTKGVMQYIGQQGSGSAFETYMGSFLRHSALTSFTGFSIISSTGTITGVAKIYGYKD